MAFRESAVRVRLGQSKFLLVLKIILVNFLYQTDKMKYHRILLINAPIRIVLLQITNFFISPNKKMLKITFKKNNMDFNKIFLNYGLI